MSIYPPNNTTPKSGNYLWNWLGSPLKKFAAALSPYMSGGEPYKKYVATLTQVNDEDPTVTVLENTLGEDITWYRDGAGYSYGSINSNLFSNPDKLYLTCGTLGQLLGGVVLFYLYDNTQVVVETYPFPLNVGPADNLLRYFTVEIRVYP